MELVIDVGNSDITIGYCVNNTWAHVWRIPSSVRTELFYGLQIRDLLLESDIDPAMIKSVALSSVVPDLTDIISTVASTLFYCKPVVVGVDVYDMIPIKVMNPYQIGSDLVANALATYLRFNAACVAVDFGTALTFTTVNGKGEIVGVSISPGLKTALRSLSQHAAKLFDVPLAMPSSVLGRNTVHAIQSGILIGCEGAVKHMLERIREEMNEDVKTIATGGLCSIIPAISTLVDEVNPTLTLDGILHIGRIASGNALKKNSHPPV
jgi:type III pantothenate kinase